jgi:hypothetical protein
MPPESLTPDAGRFEAPFWIVAFVRITWLIINIAFSSGVFADCRKLQAQGRQIRLVNPLVWVLATLLGGVLTAGVYWLVHHLRFEHNAHEDGT